jgi:PAS domain-containing protein
MELIPQIPWVVDPEGRALDVSQRWLDLTGMTDDQWRGFGCSTPFTPLAAILKNENSRKTA